MAPEEKHLAWLGVQRKLLEQRLCFAERLVGLIAPARGECIPGRWEAGKRTKCESAWQGV